MKPYLIIYQGRLVKTVFAKKSCGDSQYVCRYIRENITNNQLIVSGIGFSEGTIEGVDFDSVITLTNDKYEFLCTGDFLSNSDLLYELTSK
jgi:hypothetical protein